MRRPYNAHVPGPGDQVAISRFVEFTRAEWARLRASTPLPLTEPQLRPLVSLNERMSIDEVADVYLPLSRLLNLYVGATQSLHQATATFVGSDSPRVPFVIGIAGSVAVGKSTISRVLKALLSHWPSHPQVDLITTDGFLLPQSDARRARHHGPQGLSRKLRRAAARALSRRREVRRARGAGAGVLASALRHRARRVPDRSSSRTSSSSKG